MSRVSLFRRQAECSSTSLWKLFTPCSVSQHINLLPPVPSPLLPQAECRLPSPQPSYGFQTLAKLPRQDTFREPNLMDSHHYRRSHEHIQGEKHPELFAVEAVVEHFVLMVQVRGAATRRGSDGTNQHIGIIECRRHWLMEYELIVGAGSVLVWTLAVALCWGKCCVKGLRTEGWERGLTIYKKRGCVLIA